VGGEDVEEEATAKMEHARGGRVEWRRGVGSTVSGWIGGAQCHCPVALRWIERKGGRSWGGEEKLTLRCGTPDFGRRIGKLLDKIVF
jgi:hypothetical protein